MDTSADRPTLQREYALSWVPPGAKFGLDLGCGNRVSAPWLWGIDHHAGLWQSHCGLWWKATPAVVADLRWLPFPSNSMDFLVSVHSLEHFRHPLLVVPEWIRVLRPGGRLAIVVPDYRYTFSCRDPNQAGRGKGEAHLRDYTLTSLCVDMAQFWELEIIDARIVCPQFSVGVILEKTLNG